MRFFFLSRTIQAEFIIETAKERRKFRRHCSDQA